jgi:hypothetical protein
VCKILDFRAAPSVPLSTQLSYPRGLHNGPEWGRIGRLPLEERMGRDSTDPIGEGMTKVEIELPDATVREAREAGLLTSEALERLLTDAIRRRQAADALLAIAEHVAEAGIEPMSMEDVDREVKSVRAERRQRARGC